MLLNVLGVVAVALVATNIVLFTGNRDAQNEVATRTQYIQQSLQLEPLYQGIVRNLAEIAAKTSDPQIGQLLASHGITYTVNPPTKEAEPAKDAKRKAK
jgi:hypothetical protein